MRNWFGLIVILLAGSMLLTTGCDSDDDNDSSTPAAAEASDSGDSDDAVDPFSQVTPSGLSADVFTIAGRGTVLTLRVNDIDGATSYTFTTSMGQSETTGSSEIGINLDAAPPGGATFSVYATNDDGTNTRTATGSID